MKTNNVVILGAGLTGMSAAGELKEKCIVLEKENRVGGLVKTENYNGFWFDHVLHLLHFQKMMPLEQKIKALLGDILHPLHPEAWVETLEGTCRYPLQMHLSGLDSAAIVKVIKDLAKVTFSKKKVVPRNFEEMLVNTFGDYFCKLFMLPYNRKVWKRPLSELAPSGFQWNIDHPDFEQVLRGALTNHDDFVPYNSNGWYPRPPSTAPLRGMEVLAHKLSEGITSLHLNETVKAIDLFSKTITTTFLNETRQYRYTDYCLSTIPVPILLSCTKNLPPKLEEAMRHLKYNRVISVMLSIKGPRPMNRGHWRYYSREDISFTRLVYMHNFDPKTAPDDGWGLMTEITEPAEWNLEREASIVEKVIEDIKKVNALPADCEIVDVNMKVVSPAYVVFTEQSKQSVEQIKDYYKSHDVTLLGRYGRWEYSSMAQVMHDGYSWASSILNNMKNTE